MARCVATPGRRSRAAQDDVRRRARVRGAAFRRRAAGRYARGGAAVMSRRTSLIIVSGVLLRAFAGQILFWISYLGLPIGRSLQLGGGLWFFALDGSYYLQYARQLIAQGPMAILLADTVYPSHVFVQVFTIVCA